MLKKPITISPAARILKRSENSVRQLIAKGRLNAVRTPQGLRLLEQDDVEKLAVELENERAGRRRDVPPEAA